MDMLIGEKTRRILEEYLRREPNMTLSIGVSIGGERTCLVYEKGQITNDPTHLYNVGSITKLFTATRLAKSVCEGKFKLTDPLENFLPVGNRSPTLLSLATHTAYKPLFSKGVLWHALFRKANLSYNVYHRQTKENPIKYCRRHPVKGERDYFYADLHFALLGLALEASERKPYRTLMEDFIQNELGLKNTAFSINTAPPLVSHCGKRKKGGYGWEAENPYLAAGGLHTDLTDALTFLEDCIEAKSDYQKLVQKKQKTVLFRRGRFWIGLGWHMHRDENYYYHKGAVSGFRTNFTFDKKRKIAIAVLANGVGDVRFNPTTLVAALYKDVKAKQT